MASKALQCPIPVDGPFHRIVVDVLQLPLTARGNRYVVVFLDYLPINGLKHLLCLINERKLWPNCL